jgi:mutator protein MutT
MSSSTDRPRAATVLIFNERKEVLAVSRKTDPNDLGLPGGKVEPGESFEEAALREAWEEVGVKILKMRDVFNHPGRVHEVHTFLVEEHTFLVEDWAGMVVSAEGAWVGWVPPSRLLEGSFSEYNRALFAHLGLL